MLQPPHRPPGPTPLPLLGNSLAFARDPLGFLSALARNYGDISFLRLSGTDVYFVSHPDYVREVLIAQRGKFEISTMRRRLEAVLGTGLLTSRGELHARQRRLMQPVFRKSRIDGYAGLMVDYAERAAVRWRAGEQIDATAEMMRLTMAVVAKSLFAHEMAGDSDQVSENLSILLHIFSRLMSPFFAASLRLPLPSTLRFRRARRRLDEVIYRMIRHRRDHPTGGEDLLTLLMQARDDETNLFMTDKQLRDELMTLFLAGHETTANALSWTIYLLAQHPEVDARLHAELAAALGGRARLEADDAARLPYARQVLMEAMRLYPPAWFVGRTALEAVELGSYTVPKGATVLMSQFVMHRDERFFSDALAFRPERWSAEFLKGLPHGAYFPFSAGDRHCIGESFAWLEALLILGTLAMRWRFELVPGQAIRPNPSVTLRPSTGIRMRVHARAA
jgi:cytochrome P450